MQIQDVTKREYHIMTITDGPHGDDWTTYRRNSPNNWEVLMGESWEACYSIEDELEAAFQKMIIENEKS